MFYLLYYGTAIILIPGLIFSVICQISVNSTYKRYSKVHSKSGWVANEMSQMLLEKAGVNDVAVRPTPGKLTDNFNPKTMTVSLSEDVYHSDSIAALGVAAHEVGHAIQHNREYKPLKFRSLMVSVVNIGSWISIPLAIVGILISYLAGSATGVMAEIGEFILFLSIIAYSLTAIFALITLPVEFNASRRAKKMLAETGVLDDGELKAASKVLNAAAWTYIAALAVSILYLLRFILIIASLKRRD